MQNLLNAVALEAEYRRDRKFYKVRWTRRQFMTYNHPFVLLRWQSANDVADAIARRSA